MTYPIAKSLSDLTTKWSRVAVMGERGWEWDILYIEVREMQRARDQERIVTTQTRVGAEVWLVAALAPAKTRRVVATGALSRLTDDEIAAVIWSEVAVRT